MPTLMKRDLCGTFEIIIKDPVTEEKSVIKKQNINDLFWYQL